MQDVRATEKDSVKIYSSFRPGDIVRAEVVCLVRGMWGNVDFIGRSAILLLEYCSKRSWCDFCYESRYFLMGTELIVAGELMYPISWREMKCPKTGEVEERKTAKPI